MKLCPCGYFGDTTRTCACADNEVQRYRSRLSGPLLDRIDLHLTLAPVPLRQLGTSSAESSADIRQRVETARDRQRKRYARDKRASCNAQVSGRSLFALLDAEARELLNAAGESLALSARAYHRVVKVARTIADLAHDERIAVSHVAEALRYRAQTAG